MLTPDQIEKVNKRLESENDWESCSFMNIDLHTGARAFAMASMSWDRIAISPVFRVEQFEPKIKKGSWYLTKEGKWWVKYPTEDTEWLLRLLMTSCLKKGNSCSLKMPRATKQTLYKLLTSCQGWLSNSKGYFLNLIEK